MKAFLNLKGIDIMINTSLIDFVLEHREELRKAIDEEKQNKDTQKVGGNGNGHCHISDPTAQKAIRLVDPIGTVVVYYGPCVNGVRASRVVPDSERWLSIANATWNYFKHDRLYKFMQLKYIEHMDIKEIRKEFKIGRRRFFYMQRSIRKYAYDSAKGMHLRSADIHKHFARTDEIMKRLKEADDYE